MTERLDLLYGQDKVAELSTFTVLVVGLGGVGGYAIEALARSFIGKLILVDYDEITLSNINRQIIATLPNIGKKKAPCFAERVKAINNHCKVTSKVMKVTYENVNELFQEKIDFVLDACDNKEAKLALASFCEKKNIPLLMALGAGNRRNPALVKITTLAKTENDPLARTMRSLFRKNGLSLNIPVVYSKEVPIATNSSFIASSIFVPAVSGLTAAHYIIEYFLRQK